MLPALCLLNIFLYFLFFFQQEENILESKTSQHLRKYLPVACPVLLLHQFQCVIALETQAGEIIPFQI